MVVSGLASTTAHALSPLRNVVDDAVPDADSMAMSTASVAMVVALPDEVTSPVKFALVVTVAALPVVLLDVKAFPVQVAELPVVFWFNVGKVQFVNVPLAGVPNAGVVHVGEVKVLFVIVAVLPL